jgi:hypothetical protein
MNNIEPAPDTPWRGRHIFVSFLEPASISPTTTGALPQKESQMQRTVRSGFATASPAAENTAFVDASTLAAAYPDGNGATAGPPAVALEAIGGIQAP